MTKRKTPARKKNGQFIKGKRKTSRARRAVRPRKVIRARKNLQRTSRSPSQWVIEAATERGPIYWTGAKWASLSSAKRYGAASDAGKEMNRISPRLGASIFWIRARKA